MLSWDCGKTQQYVGLALVFFVVLAGGAVAFPILHVPHVVQVFAQAFQHVEVIFHSDSLWQGQAHSFVLCHVLLGTAQHCSCWPVLHHP